MAYDALTESIALLERGVPDSPPRISRRRRFAPLAVDVDGDVACTLFARRSVGCAVQEAWVLVRRGAQWSLLGGGGGGGFEDDDLADRPAAAALGGHLLWRGGGSSLRNAGRLLPWGARYVSYAVLRASAEVDRVVVGPREIRVPRHGHLVVVWDGVPPLVEARAADGRLLAARRVDLRRRRLPEAYRDPA
ncbi:MULTISPECIES: hypothetical protein [unclassified Blastococcus]